VPGSDVVGYIRVGPRERRSTRQTLDVQRDVIERECERRGWRLLRIEEDVQSGRTLRRPGLEAALSSCERGEAGGIVVARLDRLTYSLDHLALLLRWALEGEFNIVAPDVGLDVGTPGGKQLAGVLAVASRWRPRGLGRRAHLAVDEQRVGRGRRGRPSSTPPELAERIRGLRAGGWTLQAICDVLNAEGIPTPRGGTRWRPSSLRAILRPRPETTEEATR
jgi:DNA invertase Pin-like site-specific DNA recombinase